MIGWIFVTAISCLLYTSEQTSPVPIGFEDIPGGSHGYYHLTEKRIAIQEGMSELQTLKTVSYTHLIKREYAKAARAAGQTAQGAASTAKTTAAAAKKAAEKSRQAASFAARHWKGALIVGGVGLMLLLVMGGLQSCTAMFGSTGTGLAATSYLSEDSDMLGAEAAYAALEADLQHELGNYESLHPGYDEYRFDLDEIKHDPYVLTSILSALHNGVFTLGEVQGDLAMLFEKQYILTQTIETETRYRTETRTDSEGNTYTVEVPYTYYICNVKLENFDLSHLPIYILTEELMGFYAAYMPVSYTHLCLTPPSRSSTRAPV